MFSSLVYISQDRENRIEIVAIGFPVICLSLPTRNDLCHYSHLEVLELTDNLDAVMGEIDVLIGYSFHWSIVTEGLRHCNKGLIAINSKLGWLLSGPVYDSSVIKGTLTDTDSSSTEFSEDNGLICMLKRFWDTESIEIHINQQFFLRSVQYSNGHYEVPLPWRRDCSELCNHFNISHNCLRYLHKHLLKLYLNIT